MRRQLPRVIGHPGHVPRQHEDGEREHSGSEQLLSATVEGGRNQRREAGYHHRAENTSQDTETDSTIAPGHTSRSRQHDADNKPRFQNLTED